MSIEIRSIAGVPDAEKNPPPSLGLVAEDVVEGLKITLAIIDKDHPPSQSGPEYAAHVEALDAATKILLRFLEDLPKIGHTPVFEVAKQNIHTHRLGRLLNGEYALFEGPAFLTADSRYPINYWNRHRVPENSLAQDILPGLPYEDQLYIGYAPPDIRDMDGYAISLNYFLRLNAEEIINLGSV
jgi:hypothetical protein